MNEGSVYRGNKSSSTHENPALWVTRSFRSPGVYVLSFISHIDMFRPKINGRVFAPFWSENGYRLCPFWSAWNRLWLSRKITGVYERIYRFNSK